MNRSELENAVRNGAPLDGADLSSADLNYADLTGADLSDADLTRADLTAIKQDLQAKCAIQPKEVSGLLTLFKKGRINGSCYEPDDTGCCCFAGSLEILAGQHCINIRRDSESPLERWVLAVKPGDTPENSQIVAITVEWLEEFLGLM